MPCTVFGFSFALLDRLAKEAAALGLPGDVAGLLAQAEDFRKLRAYRNKSITHWDASDSHLATAWDGTDLTIQPGSKAIQRSFNAAWLPGNMTFK